MRTNFILIGIMMFTLAACAGGAADSEQKTRLSDDYEGALPIQFQLMAGTFMLEDTELAVNTEQAGEIVQLWKALRSLTESDTAAEAEIEAVLGQIQDAMSDKQIETIAAMQLAQEDMGALIRELDLRPELPEGFGGGDFQFPPGGFPGGVGPGGGNFGGQGPGGPGAFQDLSEEEQATRQAQREEFGAFRGRASSFLMNPLIEMLQERADL